MAKYNNPWSDSDQFVCLGPYSVYEQRNNTPTHYDLYALVDPSSKELYGVSLGARYSNDGSAYISGSLDIGWKYCCDKPMAETARRFIKHLLNK